MRGILKATFKRDLVDIFLFACKQGEGMRQSFLEQPFTRRGLHNLLKIPFESRQTSVAQYCVLFKGEIETIIIVHDPLQRNHFRLMHQRAKIGEQISILGIIGKR